MQQFLAFLAALWEALKPYLPEIKGGVSGWVAKDYVETKMEVHDIAEVEQIRRDADRVPDSERIEWLRERGLLREAKADTPKPD